MAREVHVIGLSGGKDSTALSLRLREVQPRDDYVFLCTPTGDELPEMEAHWRNLECILGQSLLRITAKEDFKGLCDRKGMLPNWRARFCTGELKIKPCQQWINAQTEQGVRVILYVGLRADEEGREGGIYENAEVRFPLRDWGWGLTEVVNYLDQRGVQIPRRTDCARCFFQTLPEWWELWKRYPEIYRDAEQQEQAIGHTFRSPQRDTWPASLQMLRMRFERGDVPRGAKLEEDLFGFSANKCRVCSL